ncbi:MAG: hypothetical protein D6694_11395 [Gammaproteobacteria bacterium]|nr:MAG: hypothetical protein D6694_11395 [Gammaproteobacteria bacterium]
MRPRHTGGLMDGPLSSARQANNKGNARRWRPYVTNACLLAGAKILQLVLFAVLARKLGTEKFGEIALGFTLVNILIPLTSLGAPTYAIREFSRALDFVTTLRFTSAAGIALSSVSGILGLTYGIYLAWWHPSSAPTHALFVTMIFLVIFTYSNIREAALRVLREYFKALAPREIFAPLLAISGVLLTGSESATGVVITLAVAYGFPELIGWAMFLKGRGYVGGPRGGASSQIRMKPFRSETRRLLTEGFTLGFGVFTKVLLQRMDLVLVGVFFGVSHAGIYAVGHRLAQAFNLIGRGVALTAVPELASILHMRGFFAARRFAMALSLKVGSIAGLCLAPISLFPEAVINAYAGPEYRSGAGVLLALAAGQAFNAATNSVTQLVQLAGQEKVVTGATALVTICAAAFQLAAAFYGTPTTVAWVSAVSLIALNLYLVWFCTRPSIFRIEHGKG